MSLQRTIRRTRKWKLQRKEIWIDPEATPGETGAAARKRNKRHARWSPVKQQPAKPQGILQRVLRQRL